LIELPGAVNASKVAPTNSAQYKLLNKTIREVFPDAVVAPGLLIGGTDSEGSMITLTLTLGII